MSESGNTIKITKNQDDAIELDALQVKNYLLANPEFFNQYPLLAEELKIPHQKKGAVSLVELQSEQLRDKVHELQVQISQLMTVAKHNEKIYRLYAELNLRLFQCSSIEEMRTTLNDSIEKEFELAAVTLSIFDTDNALSQEDRDLLQSKRFKQKGFFFGRMTQQENAILFGEQEVESVALMLLGDDGELGILAIASKESDHFSPEMDTLLIAQLQQLLTLLVSKVLG